jgi:xylulokinase
MPVLVPPAGEYVADGAARQAAWALAGGTTPPEWSERDPRRLAVRHESAPMPHVRDRYRDARELTLSRRPS